MTTTADAATRIEKDTMGEMTVPADALYGASTQRAVQNFPISGRPVPAAVVHAYGHLKAACATVNNNLGRLDDSRTKHIVDAAGAIANGEHDQHFPVDIFQTGSGTSTNMNANEVIANLICLAKGAAIGSSKNPDYLRDEAEGGQGGVHPNDHVNMGQSSNDTFPTAIHIGAALRISHALIPALERLAASLDDKANAWDKIVKIGRTHLQDATPIRVGQEFSGYAQQARYAGKRAQAALDALLELPIGGTAVGTGINTHPDFDTKVCDQLTKELNLPFRPAANHFEAQHAKDACVEASGHMKTIAVSLSKIANDIRWLGSGPRCGLGELRLPAVQPGSSIMPGKVNPVICEAVIMVSCQIVGNDAAVTMGGMGGVGSVLDLNVAMPVIAHNLIQSIDLLANASNVFVDNLLDGPADHPNPDGTVGLQVDQARASELIEGSLAMCTSLVPIIGYDKSAAIAKQAYAEGKTVRQLATEQGEVDPKTLDEALNPMSMTEPS
jgi:fumarate hydratase class II